MSWVRENTPQESIFVHWWDYGYWVQTIGERATVTDGGHANDFWNHLIGRYLLTTNNPDSALSLMKTLNASYLLIDSTDIGKYSAYSLIGSDKSGEDRASWIPVMPSDPQQSIEKANSSIKVFSAGVYTDMDIMYDLEGKIILLPKGKTIFAGVIMEITNGPSLSISSPPQAVFFYNNQRYTLPVKTLFYGGRLVHFSEGINATVMIFPGVVSRENGVEIDMFGAAAYLSEKTQNSLIAKLYLMGDPENQYPTLKLAYVEDASIIKTIKKQVPHLGNFVYYGGLVGPIKIWKTENIQKRQEFLQNIDPEEGWGELDSLQFTK
jgi:hypothetical protein